MSIEDTASATVSITVNGEPRNASVGATVQQMLEAFGIQAGRVAIERNFQILPRAAWTETCVLDGDRYEIVQFVGGG
jgi:thiamine biosynthesis protein ThiS